MLVIVMVMVIIATTRWLDEMIDKLNVYAETGVDEIIVSSSFGQNQKDLIDSMYRMSEEIIPYFKKTNVQVAW